MQRLTANRVAKWLWERDTDEFDKGDVGRQMDYQIKVQDVFEVIRTLGYRVTPGIVRRRPRSPRKART